MCTVGVVKFPSVDPNLVKVTVDVLQRFGYSAEAVSLKGEWAEKTKDCKVFISDFRIGASIKRNIPFPTLENPSFADLILRVNDALLQD